jgi:hypothetical protein
VCYLVQTDDGKNILIDSGLPEMIPEEASEFENGQDVIEQLIAKEPARERAPTESRQMLDTPGIKNATLQLERHGHTGWNAPARATKASLSRRRCNARRGAGHMKGGARRCQ